VAAQGDQEGVHVVVPRGGAVAAKGRVEIQGGLLPEAAAKVVEAEDHP
jgi:hypothetical protein